MTKKADWFVYIIEAENGKLYTGITTDLDRRLAEHTTGKGGAKFFHTTSVKKLVYQEKQPDRSLASKREAAIKKLTRAAKLKLITESAKTST